jgi:EH domain-containing protein 1
MKSSEEPVAPQSIAVITPIFIVLIAVLALFGFSGEHTNRKLPHFPSNFKNVDGPEIRELLDVYKSKLLPVEKKYSLHRFDMPEITDAEMTSLPVVLLLGQYSTGKTSFIRHMIGMDYPDIHISPEPSTDKFTAIVHGPSNHTINGNLLVGVQDLPFAGLQKFGYKFLDKFGAAVVPAPALLNYHFVDTPGVLSGEKQRIQRGYDYASVAKWLAARSDLILLFFDCSKLDISDEFRGVIEALRPYETKVKWILNKADELDQGALMRVFGSLMAAVGNIFRSVEKPRVYIGSFHDKPLVHPEHKALFERDRADLLTMFDLLPSTCIMRKVSELQKRIRRVQAQMRLMDHLRSKMPVLFGYEAAQAKLIADLPAIYDEVKGKYHLSDGDLPDINEYSLLLEKADFHTFPKFCKRTYNELEDVLNIDMVRITQMVVRVGDEGKNKSDAAFGEPAQLP